MYLLRYPLASRVYPGHVWGPAPFGYRAPASSGGLRRLVACVVWWLVCHLIRMDGVVLAYTSANKVRALLLH